MRIPLPSLRLRRPARGERSPGEELDLGPTQVDEELRRRNLAKLYAEYRELEWYWLNSPWSRAVIMQHKDTGQILYYVDEVPLTSEERKLYRLVMRYVFRELPPPPREVDPEHYFREHAKRIIAKYMGEIVPEAGVAVSWGKIIYYVTRDSVGFGPIDPLMRDPSIEDISCNGVGRPVYVWHQRYEYIPTSIVFNTDEELDDLVVKLAHMAGKHVSVAFPVVDAVLPGGHRLAATYRHEVSTGGSTFTIRKFKESPITIADMLRGNTLSPSLAAYYWLLMEHKRPGMVMGVTGSGKTTTLNALLTMLRPTVKVVTIEDTPELRLPLENWVQLTPRSGYGFGEKGSEITLYDLIRISLRYRPDIVVVGEVRGEEAYVLFQAMATGHGGMTTVHAESIDAAVKRFMSPPMNIPSGYIPLMNFGALIRRVEVYDPSLGRTRVVRRIVATWEIKSHEEFIQVHQWSPARDEHIVKPDRSMLLRVVADMRGWDWDTVIRELERRTTVMQYIMADRSIADYRAVARVIYDYYLDPDKTYERAVRFLEEAGGV